MALECANCGNTANVDAVCHHCGKPLCRDPKCRVDADDPAFTISPDRPIRAVHCRDCWQAQHEAGRGRRGGGIR